MVNGISSYGGGYNNVSVNSTNSKTYDYKSAQMETEALIKGFKSDSSSSVATLKSNSASFLTGYTSSMNSLYKSANSFAANGIDSMLYDENGEITEETIKKTVDAVQGMVDQYNDTLSYLNKNADRGPGVSSQIGRMAGDIMAEQKMDMVGVSVNKDASLKLDTEFLTDALTKAAEKAKQGEGLVGGSGMSGELNLLKDIIGGRNGLAGSIQKVAESGLSESSSRLIGNDIAEIREKQDSGMNNLLGLNGGSLNGVGAYYLNNQAAVGMMMNMFV